DVTFEALMQPHWQQTRQQIERQPVVRLLQDGTELDLSSHHKMTGLGPKGLGTTRGLLLQTVLAVLPESRQVLGCATQELFVRQPIPTGETREPPTTTTRTRNRCLDAPGQPFGQLSCSNAGGACGRPSGRYLWLL